MIVTISITTNLPMKKALQAYKLFDEGKNPVE
jgi:hypothetical protein